MKLVKVIGKLNFYPKDVLVKEGFDSTKTEKDIMKERGNNRLWDCGNKKWVINL